MAAKVWLPNGQNIINEAKLRIYLLDQPAPDKTLSDEPGKEKERRRKLEELEKRAPSPLILTHMSSLGDSY